MPKWEYTNIGTNNLADPRINNLGKVGWELVTAVQVATPANPFSTDKSINVLVLIFKRELPDDSA